MVVRMVMDFHVWVRACVAVCGVRGVWRALCVRGGFGAVLCCFSWRRARVRGLRWCMVVSSLCSALPGVGWLWGQRVTV